MSKFISAIDVGVVLFPLVAFLIALPYVVFDYRRYGRINLWKGLLFFSFVFYMLCCLCLVILPIPDDPYAVTAAVPQLRPFTFVDDIMASSGLVLDDPSTWLPALKSYAVYTVLFNVALTMPLGFYLRYYFHRRWWQAVLVGFGTSLAFELTQLTGVWGIFPIPYRIFDVDDLITNTFGCLLGYMLTMPVERLLPDLAGWQYSTLDEGDWHATVWRRLLGACVDLALSVALVAVRVVLAPALSEDLGTVAMSFVAATGVVFMLVPVLTCGRTPGQALLRLRAVRPDGRRPAWWRYVVRYGLLVWVFLMAPVWMAYLMPSSLVEAGYGSLLGVAGTVYAAWGASLLVRGVYCRLRRQPLVLLDELVAGIRVVTEDQARAQRQRRAREASRMRGRF